MNEMEADVFNKPPDELSADDQKTIVDLYKMAVDMADKVSQRRQNANNFYLSVNTALIGTSTYLWSLNQSAINAIIISTAGIAVSLLWKRNIDSYKDLNSGKFGVITEIEKVLPIAPFTAEWTDLERGKNSNRYRPFHTVEVLVPLVFVGVHMIQLLRAIPWLRAFCRA